MPYPEGSGPQREALLSGETDAASVNLAAVFPAVQAGQARVLGVMDSQRSPFLPDVPTLQEEGYDVVWGSFRVVSKAPAGIEEEQVQALESAFAAVFRDGEYVQQRAE